MALLFKMIEEGHDQFRRHIRESDRSGRLVQPGLSELKEENKGISVSCNGLWTERPLLGQVLGEIRLYERGE